MQKALRTVLSNGAVHDDDLQLFKEAENLATFLFEDEVRSFLDELYLSLADYHAAQTRLKNPADEKQRLHLIDKEVQIYRRLGKQPMAFQELVRPYLHFPDHW